MAEKEITSKDYYSLTYSVIPDNKIRQVIGTYSSTEGGQSSDEVAVNEVTNLRGQGVWSLPPFTAEEIATTSNTFQNVFNQLEIVNTQYYEDGDYWLYDYYRIETAFADCVVDIYNDDPMTYISNSLVVTDAVGRKRSRTSTSGTFINVGWAADFGHTNDQKIYALKNYNESGGLPSTKTDQEYISTSAVSVRSVTIDSYYDGSHLYGDKYLLRITIKFAVYEGQMVYLSNPAEPGSGDHPEVDAWLHYLYISKVKFNISYNVRGSGERREFEYHISDSDYANYPLRIEGNEYTNDDVYYDSNQLWCNWISNSILNKYQNGKIFISAKMKMSYLIDNNIDIDTECIIKDINNQYIRREVDGKLWLCYFKVKNIEYVCSEGSYIANVILLEDSISLRLPVVRSNNALVVDSNNNTLIFYIKGGS